MDRYKKIIILVMIVFLFGASIHIFRTSYSLNKKNDNIILYNKIINDNDVFNINDNSDGLYKDDNNYYFKGIVDNNYLTFAEELWRIVSIENNNIKIIKEEGINNNKVYKFSNDYNNGDYLTSNVFNELNLWYEDKLLKYDDKIINYDYCVVFKNDECTESRMFKIGILNYNEVVKAGGIKNINNNSYYLYNSNEWWILNSSYDVLIGSYFSGYINKLGSIEDGFVDEEKTIRPVIVLSNVYYKDGDGTVNNPYNIY